MPETPEATMPARQAAVYGLASVGFVTLVIAGIWLAVYSSRYVPDAVGRIGAAAVSLSGMFTPKPSASLLVVPTSATTTLPVTNATTTSLPTRTTPPAAEVPSIPRTQPHWTPGTPVVIATASSSAPETPHYYGLPDLAIALEAVGYSTASATSTDALVATTTIPAGAQIALKFRVTNVGTNVSGPWTVNISISSGGTIINQTFSQSSLAPGEPSDYIARFGNITPGANRSIVITVDPNHQLAESSTANNVASTSVTVLGN